MSQALTPPVLSLRYGVPVWRVRQVLDALTPPVPRAGHYRTLPADRLPEFEAELRKRELLEEGRP